CLEIPQHAFGLIDPALDICLRLSGKIVGRLRNFPGRIPCVLGNSLLVHEASPLCMSVSLENTRGADSLPFGTRRRSVSRAPASRAPSPSPAAIFENPPSGNCRF